MKNLKVGIVGVGNMGSAHANCIYQNNILGMELYALCDISEVVLKRINNNFKNIMVYDDYEKIIENPDIDVIIISTPHYFHPQMAIDAIKNGKHVLIEKPAGVYTKHVEKLNEFSKRHNKKFGIMFNQRTDYLFNKAKEIINQEEFGEIQRSVWIVTNWYRTQEYYDSGSWRASWKGEGGGVLLNQAPHNLDLWQWICGMPKRLRAFCYEAKYHNIEVEDDATIYAEFENGATGVFITSTGEKYGTNRLEITGTGGKIVLEQGKCIYYNGKSESVYTSTDENGHSKILQNFTNSILKNEDLIAPGIDGINQVMLSNAAYLSSWKDAWIDIPVDKEEFYKNLQSKINNSKVKDTNNLTHNKEYLDKWNVVW